MMKLFSWTHHPQHGVQGEGDVGDGGAAQVYCRPEWLQVEHSLQGLVGGTAVASVTGQLTVTQAR